MANDNFDHPDYQWVRGYLTAFEHINDRRNSPKQFQFGKIRPGGNLEERIRRHLGQNSYPCRDVRNVTLIRLESALDDLSKTLETWLFDFMFYDLTRAHASRGPVWGDPNQYFNLSVPTIRSGRALALAKKIVDICKPVETFTVQLETGERKWYEHGTNYVFRNQTLDWWLRLGEVF